MNIGILGAGTVGKTLAEGFKKSGHEVKLGTYNPNEEIGSYEDAAKFGEAIILCCKGTEVKNTIDTAGKENFSNKVVVDVTNPLSADKIPKLTIGYPESSGKLVQELLPDAKVAKAFNTVPANYMIKCPEGNPDLFIAGNDNAKKMVKKIAEGWGWSVIDIGDIEQSYLIEALAMTWIRYGFLTNHWTHSFKLLNKA